MGGDGAEAAALSRGRGGDAAARSLPAAAAGRGAGSAARPGENREGRAGGVGAGPPPGAGGRRSLRAAPTTPSFPSLQAPEARGTASAEAPGESAAGGGAGLRAVSRRRARRLSAPRPAAAPWGRYCASERCYGTARRGSAPRERNLRAETGGNRRGSGRQLAWTPGCAPAP